MPNTLTYEDIGLKPPQTIDPDSVDGYTDYWDYVRRSAKDIALGKEKRDEVVRQYTQRFPRLDARGNINPEHNDPEFDDDLARLTRAYQTADKLTGNPAQAMALGPDIAKDLPSEDRNLVIDAVRELASEKQTNAKRSLSYLPTAASVGLESMGQGLGRAAEALTGQEDMSSDTRRFMQDALAARESVDPLHAQQTDSWMGWLAKQTGKAVEGAPGMAMGVAALAANPALGASYFAGTIYPQRKDEFMRDGLSPEAASKAALVSAGVETGLMTVGAGTLIGGLKTPNWANLFKSYGVNLGAMSAQEATAEVIKGIAKDQNASETVTKAATRAGDAFLENAAPLALQIGVMHGAAAGLKRAFPEPPQTAQVEIPLQPVGPAREVAPEQPPPRPIPTLAEAEAAFKQGPAEVAVDASKPVSRETALTPEYATALVRDNPEQANQIIQNPTRDSVTGLLDSQSKRRMSAKDRRTLATNLQEAINAQSNVENAPRIQGGAEENRGQVRDEGGGGDLGVVNAQGVGEGEKGQPAIEARQVDQTKPPERPTAEPQPPIGAIRGEEVQKGQAQKGLLEQTGAKAPGVAPEPSGAEVPEGGSPSPGSAAAFSSRVFEAKSPERKAARAESESIDLPAEAVDAIRVAMTPEAGKQAFRESLAKAPHEVEVFRAKSEEARKAFDKLSENARLEIIDNAENGRPQANPEIQKFMDLTTEHEQKMWHDLQRDFPGKLPATDIENFVSRFWADPAEAEKTYAKLNARSPLRGSASFLKQRSRLSVKEMMALNPKLKLVTTNPAELAAMKILELARFRGLMEYFKEMSDRGSAPYVPIGAPIPEGFRRLARDEPPFTRYAPPNTTVKEAYDEQIMQGLKSIADAIGVKVESVPTMRGKTWGKGGAEGVTRRMGGPESVLAHELGHAIDEKFGMWDAMGGNELKGRGTAARELRALADLRWEGKDVTKGFKSYVRSRPEKMAVIFEAAIHAPDAFQRVAPEIWRRYNAFIDAHPQLTPLREIAPSLVLGVNEAKVKLPGRTVLGHYVLPNAVADIIDRHQSRGLRGNKLYDVFREAGNLMNEAQLGVSFFHAGFTTFDVMVSKLAIAATKLSTVLRGDLRGLRGLKDLAEIPVTPVTNVLRGKYLRDLYRKEFSQLTDPKERADVESIIQGGGRIAMDDFYRHSSSGRFWDALGKVRAGDNRVMNSAKAILNAPGAAIRALSWPVMNQLVPLQKLGAFLELSRYERERLGPNASPDDLRAAYQRAWDSVDNRLGQLVYDNLFWHRTLKDAAMASIRSVGWNVGTIRELGGGVRELATSPIRIAKGGEILTPKLAYTLALPFMTAVSGAMLMYLLTGKRPDSLEDYFFPQTGGVNPDGTPARVSLPTYMKDVYAYRKAPVQTVLHKVHPLIASIAQMLQNQDFYGTEIRNADDPITKQIADELAYAVKQFVPFSVRGTQQARRAGESWVKSASSFVGITPAPASVSRSEAVNMAVEYQRKHGQKIRTQAEADKSQARADYRVGLRQSNPDVMAKLSEEVRAGTMTARQARDLIKTAGYEPLVGLTRSMPIEDALQVWSVATPEERTDQFRASLYRKIRNSEAPPADKQKIIARARSIGLIK